MPASNWRFLLYDLRTRLPVAELPVVEGSCTFGDVLNGPGSAKFAIPLRPPDPVGLTAALFAPPNAGFAVEYGGLIRWAGPIVTHPNYNLDGGTVEFGCEGLWSYVRRRIIRTPHVFDPSTALSVNGWVPAADNLVGWRDANIGKFLLDVMQLFGTFGIDTGSVVEIGSMSQMTIPAYERRNVGETIEQNAATQGGYDWRLEPGWTAGPNSQILHRWLTSYPATGRRLELRWDQSSARILSVSVDSSNIAYTVHVTGQGTGEVKPVAVAVNQALIDANLMLEAAESASNVLLGGTLTRHAQIRLARGAGPVITPKVEVSVSDLGTFIVGDQITVSASAGILALDDWYRVTGYQVNPSTNLISVTLAPAALFTT